MINILAKVYIPYMPNIVVRLSETKLQELLLHIFCVRNVLTSHLHCRDPTHMLWLKKRVL